MLRKFFCATMIMAVCSCAYADVVYDSFIINSQGEYERTLKRITSGNNQVSGDILTNYTASRFYIIKSGGKESILTFEPVEVSSRENYDTKISVYDFNITATLRASNTFTYSALPLPYECGQPSEWGSHILLPGHGNTIAELDPSNCNLTNSYTYPKNNTLNTIKDSHVCVRNGRIYATFYVWPFKAAFTDSDTASEPYADFVEMSALGTITNNLAALDSLTGETTSDEIEFDGKKAALEYKSLNEAGGKLYAFYSVLFTEDLTFENGMYCFTGNIDTSTAKRAIFPESVYPVGICTDGGEGAYISAYEFEAGTQAGEVYSQSLPMDKLKALAIYHYDGANLSRAYSVTAANMFANIGRLKYDANNKILFAMINQGDYGSILTAFRADSSGNLNVVGQTQNVLWFDITESELPQEAQEETTDTDDDTSQETTDNSGSSGSKGGGCNSGAFMAGLCVVFMIWKKDR